jgi:hypothetical protein
MSSSRQLVDSLDREFAEIHKTSCDAIAGLSREELYPCSPEASGNDSCGEQILRCAAVTEQSFGGITANLWDDPFEWTLPEMLNTPDKVLEYLAEVETLRNRAFSAFTNDADLSKEIMTPVGPTQILAFLLDTLNRARHHQQRAFTALESLKLTAEH